MLDRRSFVAAAGLMVALPSSVFAEAGIVTPQQAHDAQTDGSLILIDIRRPEEWQQTGVAQGAWPLDMTNEKFGQQFLAVLERNPDKQVALICRTGNRSAYLIDVLKQNGINGVLDVSEGTVGGRNGTGWIKTGLPLMTAEEALAAVPSDLTAD